MRRTPIAGVVACLALALAACGGGDDGGGGTAKQTTEAQLSGRGPITFVSGKDTSGNMQKQVDAWNKDHPNEQARIIELPESADQQRQQMIQNAQTKSDAYTVLNLDVVWTAEFAANRWLVELPKSQFDLTGFLKPTVSTGQYRDRLYAVPSTSDGGLLYYRKDLLDAAGVAAPPKTWDELWAACDKVKKTSEGKGVSCYAGQLDKYEGLTVNVSEAINGAGGAVVDESGKPVVNSPQAKQGLDVLAQAFKDGRIPKQAITFKEEEGRRYFQSGKLLFHRQWPYQYALAQKKDGSSKVAGKFGTAPLPGLTGPGASTLGGHNLAISAFAKNKASAADFIKYMTGEPAQRANLLATSQAPSWAALYDDAELVKKFPYLPTLKDSILGAKARPIVVKYGDVTTAIQEETYNAITGKTPSDQALSNLQTKLGQLIQP
ncbi:ABC transporter substrate-binding protein [Actinomadura sp. HBU206391]|uniref:ABC transporter substrate-binding protein n=1 Tax=Actinomadura sp. HBU206391 TaxID=2731692 RepID=UPI00164F4BAB|nr:ABC transporter substrate-binding protein [Actinomadura sp. HBU206391]MBC6460908.1 ABC transporter substrate-binding protein [Actinomadura sp. HBU206391]